MHLGLGRPERQSWKGALWWRYHIQPTVVRPFDQAEYLHFTVAVGVPLESKVFKVFTHYSCYWGRFESRVLTHYVCCWGSRWKQSPVLTHMVAVVGPLWKQAKFHYLLFTQFSLFTQLQLLLGSLWKQSRRTCTLQLLLWAPWKAEYFTNYGCRWAPLWKQSTYLWSASEYIIFEWILSFSTKMRDTRNTSRGHLRRGAEASASLASLKRLCR